MIEDKKDSRQKLEIFKEMSTKKIDFCAEICEGMDCPVDPDLYESDYCR